MGYATSKWLYENKRLEGQFFVFIDEAHQLIPQKPPAAGKWGIPTVMIILRN